MNSKIPIMVKNIGHSFSANMITTIVSLAVSIVVPKALGIEEYGYWQLYTFYASYTGLFHFGIVNGIYLRYGGMDYKTLDKALLHSQYSLITAIQFIIAGMICISSFFLINDSRRLLIMIGVSFCCILTNSRAVLTFTLQATGKIKEYAKNIVTEKIFYAVTILTMVLFFDARQFHYLLLADLTSKAIATFAVVYVCRDIAFAPRIALTDSLAEMWINICVGSKMLLADVAGMLILGIVRFSIERNWSVATFGKVSLALTFSNLMMVFITAVSISIFPVLKRMNPANKGANYKKMRLLLVMPVLGTMVAYQPAKWLLLSWLPQYTESAFYLVLLFPLCLFEGKVSALTNNYLKALRFEKTMLHINLISMLLSLVVSILCSYFIKSLSLSILSILLLSAFRSVLSEIMISNKIGINISKDIIIELLIVGIFVGLGWFMQGWISTLIYAGIYIIYLFIQRNNIRDVIKLVLAK